MHKKCPDCQLVNFPDAHECARCGGRLFRTQAVSGKPGIAAAIMYRGAICLAVCAAVLAGFYLSLIGSAKPLAYNDKQAIKRAINVLREGGFSDEVFLLEYLTAYRSEDNWLNASVPKENAYAATNFPFEIMTVYPDFFAYPRDDVERAAILLHEAKHLEGKKEPEAYEYVWRNRRRIGWTIDRYNDSPVWKNVREQTRQIVPSLFVCDVNVFADCTEPLP